jgi:hypothetical protein
MAAERDLLPVLVAAKGIAAVGRFKFDQMDQARLDANATQLHLRGGLHCGIRRQIQVR